jgi:hypothetical protein
MICLIDPEKICNDCGECDRCDLDPTKLCDNCFRCLEPEAGKEYLDVPIDGVYDEQDVLNNQMVSACMTYIHVQTMPKMHGNRPGKKRKKAVKKYYNER